MQKSIRPYNITSDVYFEDITKCPICNSNIAPIYLYGKSIMNGASFTVFCECPSCGKTFVALFKNLTYTNRYIASNIEYLAPTIPRSKIFDKKIIDLSSNFVETYNQSLSAESYNLNQIAGMGYRKALEFLIKDYCSYKFPSDTEKIRKMLLAQCITNYIDDKKIQKLAKVSIWLGNDETHYIKKFEDKDINDLKRFIDTTVYFILYNLNVDEADDIINSQ